MRFFCYAIHTLQSFAQLSMLPSMYPTVHNELNIPIKNTLSAHQNPIFRRLACQIIPDDSPRGLGLVICSNESKCVGGFQLGKL